MRDREARGYRVWGTGTYSGTDTELEIDCEGLKKIECVSIIAYGAFDAQDVFAINETVGSDGKITVPAGGTITCVRDTPGASGRQVSYILWGY
jgi:hypothetical protein